MKLKNKTALITGGTSGIGLATARLFVAEGAQLAITGRDQTRLDAARQELGCEVVAISADPPAGPLPMIRTSVSIYVLILASSPVSRSPSGRSRPPLSGSLPRLRAGRHVPTLLPPPLAHAFVNACRASCARPSPRQVPVLSRSSWCKRARPSSCRPGRCRAHGARSP